MVPKLGSTDALALAVKILEYAESRGLKAYLDSRALNYVEWHPTFNLGRDRVDVVVVVGGDGTILRTLHLLGDMDTPVVTIRYGKRGFLADVPPYDYAIALDRLIDGRYVVHEYMRLEARCRGVERIPYALNEVAVVTSSRARGKVCRLRVMRCQEGRVEGVLSIVGDGVIIATPVGSAAYSLAAGGPIVDPLMRVILVTPLAPISLCSRPVVLPENSTVLVEVSGDSHEVELYVDGVMTALREPGDSVEVLKAPRPARVIRFFYEDFFSKVFERCL
ncbi:MAG: NAD(+)/NADH kinase [Desulfurococcaceae archaeon]|nr:NAD(+)/NADH kinase [Desulfurococcaceae archaeon]